MGRGEDDYGNSFGSSVCPASETKGYMPQSRSYNKNPKSRPLCSRCGWIGDYAGARRKLRCPRCLSTDIVDTDEEIW